MINDMKMGTRLTLLAGTLSLLAILAAFLGLRGISQSNARLQTVYLDRTVCLEQLSEISRLLQRNRLAVADSIIHPEDAQANVRQIEANLAAIGKLWLLTRQAI